MEGKKRSVQEFRARVKIEKDLSDADKMQYYGNPLFAKIHMYLTIPGKWTVEELARKFQVSPAKTQEVPGNYGFAMAGYDNISEARAANVWDDAWLELPNTQLVSNLKVSFGADGSEYLQGVLAGTKISVAEVEDASGGQLIYQDFPIAGRAFFGKSDYPGVLLGRQTIPMRVQRDGALTEEIKQVEMEVTLELDAISMSSDLPQYTKNGHICYVVKMQAESIEQYRRGTGVSWPKYKSLPQAGVYCRKASGVNADIAK